MISVIVPVYNVEKYIRACLDSIINQTYRDLEIILVDDGSTDSSGAICDEYAQKDTRIQVIHKENGGVSSARNVGLQNASGEYIGFVDSDDVVHYDFFAILHNLLNDGGDMSICSMKKFYNHSYDKCERSLAQEKVCLNEKELYSALLNNEKIYGYLWNKLFKRELIKSCFDETIHFAEDFLFCAKYITGVQKAYFYDAELYYYRQDNENAITKNTISYNHKKFSLLKGQMEIIKIYQKKAHSEINNFQKIILETALDLYGKYKYYKISNKEEYITIKNAVNHYYASVVRLAKPSQKIRYFFRKNFPLMYFKHRYRRILQIGKELQND